MLLVKQLILECHWTQAADIVKSQIMRNSMSPHSIEKREMSTSLLEAGLVDVR